MLPRILFLLTLLFCFLPHTARCQDNWIFDTLRTESKNYTVIHYHLDYLGMLAVPDKDEKLLTDSNFFSRILIINKRTQDTANVPSPIFTSFNIDEKSHLVIGLSFLEDEKFNLMIWALNGNLLFVRKFSEYEYKLSKPQLAAFEKAFPDYYNSFLSNNEIYLEGDSFYIDCPTPKDSELRNYLWGLRITNHYFKHLDVYFHGFNGMRIYPDPKYKRVIDDTIPKVLILKSRIETDSIPLSINDSLWKSTRKIPAAHIIPFKKPTLDCPTFLGIRDGYINRQKLKQVKAGDTCIYFKGYKIIDYNIAIAPKCGQAKFFVCPGDTLPEDAAKALHKCEDGDVVIITEVRYKKENSIMNVAGGSVRVLH